MVEPVIASTKLRKLLEREGTGISWADLTFNPWIGCTHVSPACDNCYAETLATNRLGVEWGARAKRRRTAASTWAKPLRWNRIAGDTGVQLRVFCASLADVFDNKVPQEWREDLWRLIEATPNLTWMLLTKRPQNIRKMVPWSWIEEPGSEPRNIEIGVTAEDQAQLNLRYDGLREIYALFSWQLFASSEPLLEALRFDRINLYVDQVEGGHPGGDDRFDACLTWSNGLTGELWGVDRYPDGREHDRPELGGRGEPKFAFVITGGESGANARPSHPDWFRALRDQCAAAGTPFHFKQWGEWVGGAYDGDVLAGDQVTFPDWGPKPAHDWGQQVFSARIGAARSGRHLDGAIHDALPPTSSKEPA